MDTDGICEVDDAELLQCKCPQDTKYITDVGCKDLKETCPTLRKKCIDTGGICEVDDKELLQCKCPQDTKYISDVGCKGICPKQMQNCEETGGNCVEDKSKRISCSCPEGTEYVSDYGCIIILVGKCSQLKPGCEEKEGVCISDKQKNIQCRCPRGMEYKQDVGCMDKCDVFGCENGGTCEIRQENPVCLCPDRFTGQKCEIDKCDGFACENGGICEIREEKPVCHCPVRFTGQKCEIDKCFGVDCRGNGECKIVDNEAICECNERYEGKNCEIDKCLKKHCNDNGECKIVNKIPTCVCKDRYEGDDCEIDKCEGWNCSGNGECKIVNKTATCECKDNYEGKNCEKHQCSGRDCNGQGECVIEKKKAVCKCNERYEGENCEIENCFGKDCSGNGECKIIDNKAVCVCHERYDGENCHIDKCSGRNCSGNGICIVKNNKITCECKKGYEGEDCERETSSSIGTTLSTLSTTTERSSKSTPTETKTTTTTVETTKTTKSSIGTTSSTLSTTTKLASKSTPTDTKTTTTTVETTKTTISGEECKAKCGEDLGVFCKINEKMEDNIECACIEKEAEFLSDDKICKVPCDEKKKCENGGTCDNKIGNKNFCNCKPGLRGHFCNIIEGCVHNSTFCGSETISGAKCDYDQNDEKEICKCLRDTLEFDERTITCRKICDASNDTCEHGSTCEEGEKHTFCKCKNGTSGHTCENIDGCKNLKCNTKVATCDYDEMAQAAFCNCTDRNKAYDAVKKTCFGYDKCKLKRINNECNKEHESCNLGECICEDGYKYSDDNETCEVDVCASCPNRSQCDPSSDNPCKCEGGYFLGEECVVYDKCDVGFSNCTQICNRDSGKCRCETGFKLSSDGVTCEVKKEADACDLSCHPGSCIKTNGKEKCACPQNTHKSVNNRCIDLCTLNPEKPPKGLNCPKGVKCESNNDDGIRCKCEDPYEQAPDGIHCIRKEMCKEPKVMEECSKKSALCKEVDSGEGYECECDKLFEFNADNTTCLRKCDFKQKECDEKNAECYLKDDYEADCRCPPLLTWDDQKIRCSKIVKTSYIGELSLLKDQDYIISNQKQNARYKRSSSITDPINPVPLEKDLREAAEYVYGKNNIKSVKIVNCTEQETLKCYIELQFNKAPTDVNMLTSSMYCYTLKEDFCLVKDLVIKREKSSNVFKETDPCIVKDIFCDISTTTCKEGKNKRTFNCSCKEGYKPTVSFNPVSDEGNMVQTCTDIDECLQNTHKCPQNTTCKNRLGSYDCECDIGFKRKAPNKDPKINGCEAVCDPNPCKNDGQCVQKRDHEFICKCKPLYTGYTCNETVAAKAVPVDNKKAAIVGGVLGTILVIVLIAFVFIYRRINSTKNDDDEEYAKHRQRSVMAEITRLQSKQRSENTDLEVDPKTGNRHARLQREREDDARESLEGRIIPRVQTSRNRNTERSDPEMSRKVSDMSSKRDDRLRSKMHYSNHAYDEEE